MFFRTLCLAFCLCSSAVAEPIKCIGHTGMVETVAFSPDGKSVVSGGIDRMVRLWDASDGKQLQELPIYDPQQEFCAVTSIAFSPDGKSLAVAAGAVPVTLWDTANWKKLESLSDESNGAQSVVFSPDGTKLAMGGRVVIRIWDFSSKKVVSVLPDSGTHLVFSPDGNLVVSISGNVWQWATLKQVFENDWLSKKQGTWIPGQAIVMSTDGKYVVGAGDGFVKWDLQNHSQVYREPDGIFFCVEISPDGKTIATGGADSSIKLWDFDTTGAIDYWRIGNGAWPESSLTSQNWPKGTRGDQ
jgi:WD40 repeat protein